MKKSLLKAALATAFILTSVAIFAAPSSVFVSVSPQKFFVERIGGAEVTVEVLVGPGQSPATLDPSPKTIARLSSAQLYFRTGVPFEEVLLKRFNGGRMGLTVVDVREGLDLLHLEEHGHADEEHGGAGEGETDPHIWLSPKLAASQAKVIAEALAKANPAGAQGYSANLEVLLGELAELDRELAAMFAPYRGREFLVFHPSFGYLAKAYGLTQVAVEREGKEPGARSMARIVDRARGAGVSAVIVQPQFADRAARAVADALGGGLIKADPLSEDYLVNMRKIAESLIKAMGGAK